MNNFTPERQQKRGSDQPQKHVALLIETSNEYARGLLKGIIAYTRTHRPWSIYLGEHSRLDTDFSWLADWRGDGLIARIETEQMARLVSSMQLPAVDLSASRLLPELPCVETNDRTIAEWAAEHLLSRGFKHFAYCGEPVFQWSRARGFHFESYLKDRGFSVHSYYRNPHSSSREERDQMASWASGLPKPVGIMACYDNTALKLLEACRLANVNVPEEAAVISVDNDSLLCNLSSPPLSSIQPNAVETGYQAAALLDSLMSGVPVAPDIHRIEPVEVVTRMSTDIIAVEDPYVADAIRYIREHAYEDLKVNDLLKVIPLSRRSLDHRFQAALGRTPHEEIIAVKMKLIARLLTETDWTLPVIADQVGYKHSEYMSVAFKKHTGLSPGAYREQQSNL
ncbi:LacI family transcriptional regulator [Paenibacillus catalpae]|uniref:LacI family transcriptional regulator n=1 Tax=Paenibacillus catalpae TaxID=1045775 RepID=A0A1I1TZ83_9BACL|nr:DNA-binding transcriptional regulator [Paenibacillus catalpae]SFD63946.1 LacI family transcriptional regulator [Paenibacillus catalpae]